MSKGATIALTGGGGLLGSALQVALAEADRAAAPLPWNAALTEAPQALAERLRSSDISHLVHCAANTNVERCEAEPASCWRDNLIVSEIWAAACMQAGVSMAYISSTGIYGPEGDAPSCEYHTPQPPTVHHKSKFKAEQAIQAITDSALILRTGWLFGGALAGKGDFVSGRLSEADSGEKMVSNTEQWGNPTFSLDVAHKILTLIEGGYSGVFNCVNSGAASRYDYVCEVMKQGNRNTPVEPRPAAHFKRVAPVSANETALNWKLGTLGLDDMEDWRIALARYMHDFGVS